MSRQTEGNTKAPATSSLMESYFEFPALAVGTNATKPAASALPLTSDQRWEHDDPPKGNANFGWLQRPGIRNKTAQAAFSRRRHHPDVPPHSDATPGVASMSSNTKCGVWQHNPYTADSS